MEGAILIERILNFLIRLKNGPDHDDALGITGGEDDDYEDVGEPLTWAEQKCIRTELRRFQLWQALRLKVPKGFEEGV